MRSPFQKDEDGPLSLQSLKRVREQWMQKLRQADREKNHAMLQSCEEILAVLDNEIEELQQ